MNVKTHESLDLTGFKNLLGLLELRSLINL